MSWAILPRKHFRSTGAYQKLILLDSNGVRGVILLISTSYGGTLSLDGRIAFQMGMSQSQHEEIKCSGDNSPSGDVLTKMVSAPRP